MPQMTEDEIVKAATMGPQSGRNEPAMTEDERIRRALAIPKSEIDGIDAALISTVKENPQEVVTLLNKRGFNAKLVEGEAAIEQPDGRFVPFNKPGFQTSDLALYAPDIVEALAGGFATGSKLVGTALAPFTGGGSLATGIAAGGLATGGVEALRQGIGVAAGAREGFDVGRIAQQGAIGGASAGLFGIAGKTISKGAEGLRKIFIGGPRKIKVNPGAVEEAAKVIGAPLTPAQTTTLPGVKMTEEIMHTMKGGFGGSVTRARNEAAERQMQEVAEGLVSSKLRGTAAEVGEKFKSQLIKSVGDTLKKSEKLYSEVQETLKAVPAWSAEKLSTSLDDLVTNGSLRVAGPEAKSFIKQVQSDLKNIVNVEDLKALRTSIGKRVNATTASDELKSAADKVYALVSKSRKESFDAAIKAAKEGGENPEIIEQAVKKLNQADKLYKAGMQRIQRGVLQAPKSGKVGTLRQVESKIANTNEETIINKLFKTGSASKVKDLNKLSPEAADTAREFIKSQLKDKMLSAGKGGEHLKIQSLTSEIGKWSPEVATFVLGKDGYKKAQALQTFYRSMPRDLNPSGSFKEIFRTLALNPIVAGSTLGLAQVGSMSMSAFNIMLRKQKEMLIAGLIGGVSQKADMKDARERDKANRENKAKKIILNP